MVWQNQAKQEMELLKQEVLSKHKAWKEKHRKLYEEWLSDRKKYNNEVDDYKKTLIKIPLVLPVSKNGGKDAGAIVIWKNQRWEVIYELVNIISHSFLSFGKRFIVLFIVYANC